MLSDKESRCLELKSRYLKLKKQTLKKEISNARRRQAKATAEVTVAQRRLDLFEAEAILHAVTDAPPGSL